MVKQSAVAMPKTHVLASNFDTDFTGLSKNCGSTEVNSNITVTDACGNSNTTTASFTVVDTTAPVFSTNLPLRENNWMFR